MTPELQHILITYFVPLVIAAIAHWLGRRYPAIWANVQTALPPEAIDELAHAVGTQAGREAYTKQLIERTASCYGVELTAVQLNTVVAELERCWNAGVKFAGSALKKG